ncbi:MULTISPECIES: NAD-dependent epimerase/dehydratase family protein [Natrialbaceae]|uniref:NAD-dependent epimerase/dehydratase family protein n=1 Tax=Natrialbaceae TaxID=1644061 RepID=UPI00207CCBDF|nr:NAD-dependent epimerase/dehydratase family protein [Natronococcus sp. CG52]
MGAYGPVDQRILVTGGAGFIGSHLADSLVENNDVRVLDSFTTGETSNVPDEANCIRGDIRNEGILERATDGVDLIYHQAGLVSVQRSIEEPSRSHEINVHATLALLERARELDVRIVLASSAAIYGHPEEVPITEDDPKEPRSPYGLEKLTIDHYARQYHELYGLETVALRYFNVYGPRQAASDYSGAVSTFIEQAANDDPLTIHGGGTQTRDFVFVDDVVRANLLAADTDRVGEAYNVGSGRSVAIRELAETAISVADADSDLTFTDARRGDVRHSEADLEKSRTEIGYEPTVSLRQGLEQTINRPRGRIAIQQEMDDFSGR